MFPKIFENTLIFYRILGIAGAIFFPLFWFAFPAGLYDPMALRWTMSGLFLGFFALSFAPKAMHKYLQVYLGILLYLVTAWVLFLLFRNDFEVHFLLSYILICFSGFLLMPNNGLVYIYLAINLLGFGYVCFSADYDYIEPFFVFIFVLLLCTIGTVVVQGRLTYLRTFIQDEEEKNFIRNAAIGASRDGILLVDLEGKFIRANETFFKFWHFTPEWLAENDEGDVKEAALSMVADRDRYERMMDMPIKEGKETHSDVFEMTDGTILEISFIVVRMDAKPVGRMWFFKDITEQRRSEEELRASERRLRQRNDKLTELAGHPSLLVGELEGAFEIVTQTLGDLLEANTCSIWFFDYEARKMICKKHYKVQEGSFQKGFEIPFETYSAYFEEVLRTRIFAVHDTKGHPLADEFREGKHTGSAGALCHAQIRAGGHIIGLLTVEQKTPRKWSVEDQSFVSSMADLVAISIEISRRKKIGEELERSFAILKATFDLSETGILVVDHEQNVIDYNDLYLKTWNMDAKYLLEEPYETKLQHLLGQVKDARNIEEGARVLSLRPGMEYAGIIEFKDGRVVERYSKGLKVGNEVIGRVWFYLDITDRKRKENELISRNFELDSFVYRASHDLKAPLNSIMGLIGIILEENELEPVLQYVRMMDKSVKKLEEFIKQLTQFSQDARLQVVEKPIVFQALVEEIWEDLRFMENANRVQLELDIQQEGPFFSDPIRLAIVFNNVISNSIKYQDLGKEAGSLKIQVRSDGEWANCRFEDNGVGIDPDHLQKVFDLFFRASVQATGSGLGLYITHNAVEKLGGQIDVDSEKGRGTIFELQIPNRLASAKVLEEELEEQP